MNKSYSFFNIINKYQNNDILDKLKTCQTKLTRVSEKKSPYGLNKTKRISHRFHLENFKATKENLEIYYYSNSLPLEDCDDN